MQARFTTPLKSQRPTLAKKEAHLSESGGVLGLHPSDKPNSLYFRSHTQSSLRGCSTLNFLTPNAAFARAILSLPIKELSESNNRSLNGPKQQKKSFLHRIESFFLQFSKQNQDKILSAAKSQKTNEFNHEEKTREIYEFILKNNADKLSELKEEITKPTSFIEKYILTLTDDEIYQSNPDKLLFDYKAHFLKIKKAEDLVIESVDEDKTIITLPPQEPGKERVPSPLSGRTSTKSEIRGEVFIHLFKEYLNSGESSDKNLYHMLSEEKLYSKEDLKNHTDLKYMYSAALMLKIDDPGLINKEQLETLKDNVINKLISYLFTKP